MVPMGQTRMGMVVGPDRIVITLRYGLWVVFVMRIGNYDIDLGRKELE